MTAHINNFKAFATSLTANVEAQADYELDPALPDGFNTGTANSQKLNKVWRQASFIAAAIGQFVANTGHDVLDDGNLTNFLELFLNARGSFLSKNVAGGSNVTLDPYIEANYATLYFTGVLTANIVVFVPASRNAIWNIINVTTGAFTLEVRVIGGSGVVIPQAASSVVASDGVIAYLIGSIAGGGGGGGGGVMPIGVGQTWVNKTSVRTSNVVYTNTTSQSIMLRVYVATAYPNSGSCQFTIGGVALSSEQTGALMNGFGTNIFAYTIIVPPGFTYKAVIGTSYSSWWELTA